MAAAAAKGKVALKIHLPEPVRGRMLKPAGGTPALRPAAGRGGPSRDGVLKAGMPCPRSSSQRLIAPSADEARAPYAEGRACRQMSGWVSDGRAGAVLKAGRSFPPSGEATCSRWREIRERRHSCGCSPRLARRTEQTVMTWYLASRHKRLHKRFYALVVGVYHVPGTSVHDVPGLYTRGGEVRVENLSGPILLPSRFRTITDSEYRQSFP